jgi:hypothetical protein
MTALEAIMLRTALLLTLGLCTCACALETPLTLSSGSKVSIIDPAYGSITVYEPSASKTERLGLGKPSANFLADIDVNLKTYLDERDGVPFQALRVGTVNNKPLYKDMFTGGKWFPDKPTKSEAAAGKQALQSRVARAEDAFWKANPTYDGVVRAAYSSSGRYLALVVPSLHTLLVYSLDSDTASLAAIRNWGPELFLTGFNSSPSPKDFLSELKGDKLKEAKAALGIDDETAGGKDAAAPPALAAEEPPTPKSDAWIAAGQADSFLIVDVPNKRAMLYQMSGKNLTLNAARDLAVDLVVPGLIGGSWHCNPPGEKMLEAALRGDRKSRIEDFGLPSTKDELMLLVGQSAAKGKVSPFEGVMGNNGIATLNFVESRVFLVLDTKSGMSLALGGARDYTLDIAVALLDKEILDRTNARKLLGDAATLAGQAKLKSAVLTLRLALSLDPRLHTDAETKMKGAFRKDADLQAQFQALIDEAVTKADELAKQADERKKALEDKKKAK